MNQPANPLLQLLAAAASRGQRAAATVEPPKPGSFSHGGRNYGIGDEFNGAKVLDASKIPSNLLLVDDSWGEIKRPESMGNKITISSDQVMEFNPENEEHQRIKAEQDAKFAKDQAAYEKALNSPGRRFLSTEKISARDYKDTYYIEREGALIPVGSRTRYQPSGWVAFRDEALKPAAMIALSTIGAPMLGAALGGGALGTIGAGAAISGATTAAGGGNSSQIFRNALIGGASAGLSRVANPAIKTALGGTQAAGGVASAITNAGIASIRGGDPLQAALMGGVSGTSPEAGRVLRTLMQLQRMSQGPRPQSRTSTRRG